MSILNASSRSELHPSNSSLYTEEIFIKDMRNKEKMETECIAHQIPKLNDNFNFYQPSSPRLLYCHDPNIITKEI